MKKKSYYLNEFGFLALLTFVVIMLLSDADAETITGSVYPVFGLLSLPLLYSIAAVLIGSNAQRRRKSAT